MQGISAKTLSGDARRKWVEQKRKALRQVLTSPSASEVQKFQARKKLDALR
jgi:hypothetical protein